MPISRRTLLVGLAATALPNPLAAAAGRRGRTNSRTLFASDFGVEAGSPGEQTSKLQAAIDAAAERRLPLILPPGRIASAGLHLRPGSHIEGMTGASTLVLSGGNASLAAHRAGNLNLSGFSIDGLAARLDGKHRALIELEHCRNATLSDLSISKSHVSGIMLAGSSGRITRCQIDRIDQAAIFSLNARGLAITQNTVSHCANNGILVWRSRIGEDGTLVTGNRISHVRSASGGTGQNGNGINIFRAGNVIASANHITDCAYSAVRNNSGSNVQIINNNCARIGEVALYAEFAFQGTVISSNIVDAAATGISVTNFNDGGRLATVHGNVLRNLTRREHEPVDKRGVGIAVEADTAVVGNVIEAAASAGIAIGWHQWMRNVIAANNIIRQPAIGIAVTGSSSAGTALLTNNLIAQPKQGAIRTMRGNSPYGPDLARASSGVPAHLRISGTVVS